MLLSVPKPHYASKQSGAQLHPPRTGAERPCPRSSGRAQEAAAEAAASSGRRHQQQKTTRQRQLHYSHTHIHPISHFTEERKPGADFTEIRPKRARDRPQINCEGSSQLKRAHKPTPHFFFFSSHPSGGGCMPRPRISRRGASFQHALQAQIPKPACLP